MNRRTFCSLAVAASSAPLHPAYKKIRVAVLGTGHAHALGKIHALRSLPEYELAGICRPDADEPNEGEVFRDVPWLSLDEVLQDSSIELVDVESRTAPDAMTCCRLPRPRPVAVYGSPGQPTTAIRILTARTKRRRSWSPGWKIHPLAGRQRSPSCPIPTGPVRLRTDPPV